MSASVAGHVGRPVDIEGHRAGGARVHARHDVGRVMRAARGDVGASSVRQVRGCSEVRALGHPERQRETRLEGTSTEPAARSTRLWPGAMARCSGRCASRGASGEDEPVLDDFCLLGTHMNILDWGGVWYGALGRRLPDKVDAVHNLQHSGG